MDDDVQFMEDKTFLAPLPDTTIPEKSIEGWFYKHVPGSVGVKKFILLCFIILLFAISIILFLLSRPSSTQRAQFINMDNVASYEIL